MVVQVEAATDAVRTMEGAVMSAEPAARRLGDHLRSLRESRGWGIETAARKLDWTTSYVQYIETRKKTMLEPHELQQIADLYEVSVESLLNAAGYQSAPAA